MNTDKILNTFDPLLTAALERLDKFNRPEPKDVARFFGPCFEAIARAADLEPAVLTDWLATQGPDTISRESIHVFVRSLTEAPANVLEAARLRQTQLEAQIAAEKPLTARETVLMDRQQPLSERSRRSIEDELYEAHFCKTRDDVDLPDLSREQWRALEPHYAALEQEIAKRDCRIHGLEYHPPVESKNVQPVGYAMPVGR